MKHYDFPENPTKITITNTPPLKSAVDNKSNVNSIENCSEPDRASDAKYKYPADPTAVINEIIAAQNRAIGLSRTDVKSDIYTLICDSLV